MNVLTAHPRTLILSGDCDTDQQEQICGALIRLNLASDDDITLYIDSNGGGIYPAIHIYDAIKESRAPVYGIVIGKAVSAAFVALLACHNRAAFPHAMLMYHAPTLAGIRLDDEDFEHQLTTRRTFHDIMLSELVRRGNASRAQFEQWSREERYLNAHEALEAGILDQVTRPWP